MKGNIMGRALKPVIYLDQDGVLADFERWAVEQIGDDWRIEIDKEEWGRFGDFPDMYSELPVMPGALNLYRMSVEIMQDKNQVQILTALPNRAYRRFPNVAQHKIEWAKEKIDQHLRVVFGPHAQHKQFHVRHPHDLLIDDMVQNVLQWREAGGIGIVYRDIEQVLTELEAYSALINRPIHQPA